MLDVRRESCHRSTRSLTGIRKRLPGTRSRASDGTDAVYELCAEEYIGVVEHAFLERHYDELRLLEVCLEPVLVIHSVSVRAVHTISRVMPKIRIQHTLILETHAWMTVKAH